MKTLYRKPGIEKYEPELRYQNRYRGTAGTKALVPKPGLNWKISTVPTQFFIDKQHQASHGDNFHQLY